MTTKEDAELAVSLLETGARANGTAAGTLNGQHYRARSIRRAKGYALQFKICAPGYDPSNDNGYTVIQRAELIERIIRGPYIIRLGRVPAIFNEGGAA